MISSHIFMWAWLVFGLLGLITGNDPVFVVGLVASTAHAAAINVMTFINKKENK